MVNKILIIGPIGDFGGRELEAGFIAKSLAKNFDVTICSTGDFTNKSQLFDFVKKEQVVGIKKLTFKNNFILRIITLFSFIKNKGKHPISFYINNRINKKYLNLDKRINNQLKNIILEHDLVLVCAQLSSNYIEGIINYSFYKKKPILFRTTGNIKIIPNIHFSFLNKVSRFIHHSEVNAASLNLQITLPYVVIDQCAFNEDLLLNILIRPNKKIVFGYLGRLSQEKGILQFLKKISIKDINLVIAGDGNLKNEILNLISNYKNIKYIGKIEHKKIDHFFEKIDVIVIPSIEESGPLVALESMAAGKLIVSTDVGAMQTRLCGLKSYWFDYKKTEEELNIIFDQIKKKDLKEILIEQKKLRQRYLEKYSKENISKQYLELIQKEICE